MKNLAVALITWEAEGWKQTAALAVKQHWQTHAGTPRFLQSVRDYETTKKRDFCWQLHDCYTKIWFWNQTWSLSAYQFTTRQVRQVLRHFQNINVHWRRTRKSVEKQTQAENASRCVYTCSCATLVYLDCSRLDFLGQGHKRMWTWPSNSASQSREQAFVANTVSQRLTDFGYMVDVKLNEQWTQIQR